MRIEELNGKPFESIVSMAQLLREPVGSSHSYHADEVVEDNSNSVQGEITLIHGGQRILLRAELTVNVELTCSRCLEDFIYPVNLHIEEGLVPTTNIPNDLPLSEESTEFTIDNHNMLDLGEIIRQYTLLNLPMKPICQPNCTGIKEVSSHGFA
ncbi:MAG: DUF177 domain-containing protein [Dehalococcoidia bacterium]|nr:DUF177 domain-containing protein [Dehalococcoidia bacterium]